MGFPGGSVVKNLPDNAGSTGSIPDPGRSHMPWTYWACTSQLPKPACLRACAPQEKPPQWAAWIPQLANSPQLSTTREKPAKDPAQPKTKKKNKKTKKHSDTTSHPLYWKKKAINTNVSTMMENKNSYVSNGNIILESNLEIASKLEKEHNVSLNTSLSRNLP